MSIFEEWKAIIEAKAPEATVFLGRRKWADLVSNEEAETFVFFDIEYSSEELLDTNTANLTSTENYLVYFLSKSNIDNSDTVKAQKIEDMKKLARESWAALTFSSAQIDDVQQIRARLVPIIDQMQGYFTGCVLNINLPLTGLISNACPNS